MPVPLSVPEFRGIETELSRLRYGDIPIGWTLSDQVVIDFFWGNGDWRRLTKWLNQARRVRHRLLPRRTAAGTALPDLSDGVLVTWLGSTPRIDGMMLPIVEELGGDRCAVIMGDKTTISGLAPEVPVIDGGRGPDYCVADWRKQYGMNRPGWAEDLKSLCLRYELPAGAFEALSLGLLASSQRIERFSQFLREHRPSVVLTEYDRNHLWSCLVLAARHLRIATVTLVHGVIPPTGVGFAPALADRIICWGEADKNILLSAGERAEKIVVGGCPRLTRGLPDSSAAREKLDLAPEAQVALLATSPDRGYLQLAELFCSTLEGMTGFTGIVRLHPAEDRACYAEVARRHPGVRFMENAEATLDEALAVADVVVVRGSGVGSDALTKRRPVVVLEPGSGSASHGTELVKRAGCPLACTAEELSEIVRRLVSDATFRESLRSSAEHYVNGFCAAFGQDAARRIVETVEGLAGQRVEPR